MSLKIKPSILAVMLAVGPMAAHSAEVDPVVTTGMANKVSFDFGYRSNGEQALIPLQVFDDGTNTYFKFRTDRVVPDIALIHGQSKQPLRVLRSSPYLVVNAVGTEFEIRYGELEAHVRYSGKGDRAPVVGEKAALLAPVPLEKTVAATVAKPSPKATFGAVNPMVSSEHSFEFLERITPVEFAKSKIALSQAAEKAILQALAVPGKISEVRVVGRENLDAADGIAQLRAFAIRDRLISAGIPVEKISIKTGISDETSADRAHSLITVVWQKVHAKPEAEVVNQATAFPQVMATVKASTFKALVTDGGVPQTLQRWGKESGWTVVWHASVLPKLQVNASYTGDFLAASSQLLQDVMTGGYALEVEAYSNQVLEVRAKQTRK